VGIFTPLEKVDKTLIIQINIERSITGVILNYLGYYGIP
tara:strand:+ start:192 stop:308 length:117 start_codon:yes stop_codon:yes gene_type:complete